jgi:hypothetical protein
MFCNALRNGLTCMIVLSGAQACFAQSDAVQVVAGDGAAVSVPSGQAVTLQDVIWNEPGPDGLTVRFRFVAPQIAREGGTVPFETASEDMAYLCNSYAIPRLSDFGPAPAQIVISFSDVPVAFGDSAPQATQFFEAYRIENGTCEWDMY